jgi:hydroxyacylglutathione hydrolase
MAASSMTVKSFTFNPFQTNCYIAHANGEAALIDPGTHTVQERQAVLDYLERHALEVTHLLLTHAHIDHIFGCAFFAEHFGRPFQMHAADKPFIARAEEQAKGFGFPLEQPPLPDTFLEEGDTLSVAGFTWKVLHTPGHSPGSITFYDEANGFAISGDVLFSGSIGRTEGLPQTSLPQLIQSIFDKLVPLGDDVTIYPGHGPKTTIGAEQRRNPFLTGQVPGVPTPE